MKETKLLRRLLAKDPFLLRGTVAFNRASKTNPHLLRYGHSAVLYNNRMYIFGGYDNTAMTCNDIYSLNLGLFLSFFLPFTPHTNNKAETQVWEKVPSQGTSPPSCFMHTATVHDRVCYFYN